MQLPPLASLGPRIAICGPSNSGKSTLAVALREKLGCPAVHLDQLHHLPGTDWVPRPKPEFKALHDAAIGRDSWVIDGNYRGLLPARLARATGLILLGSDRWSCLWRYLRRTQNETDRVGGLPGASEKINPWMVWYILAEQPGKMRQLGPMLRGSGAPLAELPDWKAVLEAYTVWSLQPSTDQ